MTDEALDQDIARVLAVDPSPEFVARVRTRIANEPEPGMWRRALALRSSWLVASVAAAVVAAVVVTRSNRSVAPANDPVLAARAIGGQAATLPYVASGFRRSAEARPSTSSGRAKTGIARGEPVEPRARRVDLVPLLDPRETRALRALIARVRDSRVDLSPLLRAGAPAPMELPPVEDLVIAPLAIEPLAPIDGAQGVRQ